MYYTLKNMYAILTPSSPLLHLLGLCRAVVLTLALAVLCRFLPGGTGDRSGGVAVAGPSDR